MRERAFDVVVWGATGFTGKLVAEYLAEHHGSGPVRWALGGRSREKLEAVRRELAARWPAVAALPLLVADARDRRSLAAMTAQTSVVCSTVGPYAQHGNELVAACVETATDYTDLTGETPWIRRMVAQHHEAARQSGARIVHCCGFDSIPSDLGAQMMVEHLRERHDRATASVRAVFGPTRGGFSGGTAASLIGIVEEAQHDPATRRALLDPYALDPADAPRGPASPDQRGPVHDPDLGVWTAPFVMAGINTRVVRRSNALLGHSYGPRFVYNESIATGRGPSGLVAAAGVTAATGAFLAATAVPPVRHLIQRLLPAPGEGPSRDSIARGFFKMRLVARSEGAPALVVRGLVAGERDPGYGETAKMIAEASLCLALDQLPAAGGVLTPAAAMGKVLRERLVRAGMTFAVSG
jgi:short subunit dehydrogenase-like uncharacterized protein